MEESQAIINDFLVESHESLDQLDRDLVALEQNPHSKELLSSIFRTIHTIKGTCGFLGFGKLEKVSHVGENLLSKLRDGEITLRPVITTGLLSLVDAVRRMLECIESLGNEGDEDFTEVIELLSSLQDSQPPAHEPAPMPLLDEIVELVGTAQQGTVDASTAAHAEEAPHESARPQACDSERGNSKHPSAADARTSNVSDSTIRVDVALLDKLMTRVGELVLARNQILQYTSNIEDSGLQSTSQRLNLITTELQEGVMKTRMQPIGNVWSKFPRMVRDLAAICGKQVRIEMEGKETELDKTIIEAIKDPLTHLVRNTVDHGIETAETRIARGKAAEGCLLLRAFHEGGQVNIEIIDDGAGLNLERIKQKGLERGLITSEQAARLADRDIAQLIFLPGFSTAEKISNVSGRGVGMDVVKTNIEKIGGTVDLQTQAGLGTNIKIKIPLTLAIIPALIVTADGDRYAIPQVNLLELVRLEGEQTRSEIEWIQGAPVYRLRGRLLPLVYLRRELQIGDAGHLRPTSLDATNIVVLRADDRQFGLVVDRINDTEEIVVKPLSKQLKSVSVYSGTTIMGDGKVALILDVLGLAHSAHVIAESHDRNRTESQARGQEAREARQTLLVLGIGPTQRYALPISLVERLEKIDPALIEHADHQEVVQYRGDILPLVRLSNVLGVVPCELLDEMPLQVIVYTERGHSVGLVVDRIVDIVETQVENIRRCRRSGLLGTAVIQDHVTDLLDLPAIIRQIDPQFNFGSDLVGTGVHS
ncbi:CheA signal transduction histidine kinase [Pirellula staleyi DSM 6068]|uniref:histidine kinase n=1 Tax=Pirellula staleyi (strain ATCC 27377 / DSM 6068 / ICPB 4128) TaxID=530564 RepID=D2R9I8_PIRSD|nr:chemotaxis protein CheW [Pirellula staleyi]ADB17738.1 CheA signal transduction histidine kinase [Pirellula staleyi DSM 6068]